MSEKRTSRWGVAIAGMVLILVGSGGCGSSDSSSTPGLSFSVAPSTLNFTGVAGDTVEPPTQQFSIVSSGGTVYLDVSYAGTAYAAGPLQISGSTATATVRVPAPSIVGAGVHTGTVTIRGYEYQFGGNEVSGSPKQVSVIYSVAGLAANPSLLVFNQTSGGPLPGAQSFTLSLSPAASDSWSATTEVAPIIGLTVPNWLQVSPTSGTTLPATLSVSVIAQGQPGIEYDGYINFTATNGSALRYHVIYRAR